MGLPGILESDVRRLDCGGSVPTEIKKCRGREGERGGREREGRSPPAWEPRGARMRPWWWGALGLYQAPAPPGSIARKGTQASP